MPNTSEETMEAKKVRDSRLDTVSIVVMFYTLITGVSFIFFDGKEIANQVTYERMQDLASIKVWGLLFCLSAVLHLVAVIVEYRRLQYVFFVVAGVTGFILYLLYSVASFDTTIYKINAFRYLLYAGFNLTVALKGVIARKQEKVL
ncbi:hypothetical protein [Priestia megaterium]